MTPSRSRWLLALLLLLCASCSYAGPFVTRISPGPGGTMTVETAEVRLNGFFGLVTTVNRRTEQVPLR